MEININNDTRIAEVWLSKLDLENPKSREYLKKLCSEYKQQKYMVAVYESGFEDLQSNTIGLLLHNRIMKV